MVQRLAWRKRRQEIGAAVRLMDDPPLRAELFSVEQLERHAKLLAGLHSIAPSPSRRRVPERLLPRLADNQVVLQETYELVVAAVKRGRRITPASEWFLDNFHLIEEQIRTARKHLPRRYIRQLPLLSGGPSAGLPRVYDLALELIAHVDGRIDADSLRTFVAAYQLISPLQLGELWAVPIMLRLALLENLRRVASRLASGRRDRERADYWITQLVEITGREPTQGILVLADMIRENPPLTTPFVAEFASQLQGRGTTLAFTITWLEQRLAEQSQTLESIFQDASQNQAADQVSVGNSINSLRLLGAIEWRSFVEEMSVVDRTLRRDPAHVYPAMDFATRDRYRHAVEEIARRSDATEDEVAAKAVELAQRRLDGSLASGATSTTPSGNGFACTDRTTHVGYFLIDNGRRALQHSVKARATAGEWLGRLVRQLPLVLYLAAIGGITVVATAVALWWISDHGLGPFPLIVLAIPTVICLSQFAISLVHWAATVLAKPRILPRMDFSHQIPPQFKTIVAVPTMLGDAREIADLLESMEVHFLANRSPSLLFALLSDFYDATEEKMPNDVALLQQAVDGISALNAKYGDGFFLFHRFRRWNAQEGVWMGWERKRGKLEEFNAMLRGAPGKFDTVIGPTTQLANVKYVITLDSDTELPRESARQLIGTLAHPLNRPRFDPKRGRVVEGYGILQPRVGVSMPIAGRSRYAQLFAGEPGIDPYTRAVSDVYQDLFDEGSFIGKGIYDVDTFNQVVGGKLPQNRILSHDLLEGAYARGGLVSDVVFFEEYPPAYPVDVSRRYRWIRGDWQITPWLLMRVPGGDARRVHNPISALSRWKILDNMRRSLVPPALLALLLLGWLLGEALFFTLLTLGIVILPSALTALAQLAHRPADVGYRHHGRVVARTVARQLLQDLFSLACLPYDAAISLEAIGRTAARVLITGRKLLEWRTARDALRSARADLPGFYLSMWIQPALAAAVMLGLTFARTARPENRHALRADVAHLSRAGLVAELADSHRSTAHLRRRQTFSRNHRPPHLAILRGLQHPGRQLSPTG